KIGDGLMVNGVSAGETENNGLNGEQATRLQGVTLEGHGQGKNEFNDQCPTGNIFPGHYYKYGVKQQEPDDGLFVPARRIAQKIRRKGVNHRVVHQGVAPKCWFDRVQPRPDMVLRLAALGQATVYWASAKFKLPGIK